jgi:hypothetical protein
LCVLSFSLKTAYFVRQNEVEKSAKIFHLRERFLWVNIM